ncbi:MAG: hypothetical protein MUE56_08645, partial [Ignavibacteria bacterium]|nr:hypothetical protein [Ignavibacteria bacterium]
MKNPEFFDNELFEKEFESDRPKIIDYIGIIRASVFPIILIFIISLIVTFLYLKNYPTIYRATTIIKIEKPRNGIMEQQSLSLNLSLTEASDRYMSNQIEILKGFYIRDMVAKVILDSMQHVSNLSAFSYVVDKIGEDEYKLATQEAIRRRLLNVVKIEVKRNVDALTVSLEGLSFHEIQMIVNIYSNVFVEYSKEINKEDLISVKKFLEDEKDKKYKDLESSEQEVESFQRRSGYVSLDEQSRMLIEAISKYDFIKNEANMELKASENTINNLRKELDKIDPKLYDYVSGQISQPYIQELQRNIAEIEIKRDLDLSVTSDTRLKDKIISDAQSKINKLNVALSEKTEILRAGLLANTPDERRDYSQKIIHESLLSNSLKAKMKTVEGVLSKYEVEFNKLPEQSIELAKLERIRKSNEKLYLALEEKYQEATINERSRLGYAS